MADSLQRALTKYNDLVAIDHATPGSVSSRDWGTIAERLTVEVIHHGVRGSKAEFCRARINDALIRAGRTQDMLHPGWRR